MRKAREKRPPLLRPLLRRYAGSYLLGLLTLFLVDYVNLFIPQLMGEVTDGLAVQGMDAAGVLSLALRIVLCGAVVAVGRFFWRYFLFGSARKIERELRNRLFARLETLSQRYFNRGPDELLHQRPGGRAGGHWAGGGLCL